MTTNKKGELAIRENRLNGIIGYNGMLSDLVAGSKKCSLQNQKCPFSQATTCSSECAHNYLTGIMDAVVVNHAPVGCGSDAILYNMTNNTQMITGGKHKNLGMFSTNLSKQDTVFGAVEKLKDTVREAYRRHHPKAIFVTTSCVSGIIGEDIQSAVDELKKELDIPIAPVFCEGFKTKIWAYGWDAALHAIITNIVKPPRFKTNNINMINFHMSARKEMTEIFTHLGYNPVYLVPWGYVADVERMAEATATISVCDTLGTYGGSALQREFGVPYIRSLNAHGIAGTESLMREFAKVVGKEAETESYIAELREKIEPDIRKIREKLEGLTVVLGMGSGYAADYVRVLKEFGVEVIWSFAWHVDQQLDDEKCQKAYEELAAGGTDLPITVNEIQSFELLNKLNKLRPDIYISRHPGTSIAAAKLGITTIMDFDVDAGFGFRGTVDFGYRLIDVITNKNREAKIAQKLRLPYTDWWMQQNSFKLREEEE